MTTSAFMTTTQAFERGQRWARVAASINQLERLEANVESIDQLLNSDVVLCGPELLAVIQAVVDPMLSRACHFVENWLSDRPGSETAIAEGVDTELICEFVCGALNAKNEFKRS